MFLYGDEVGSSGPRMGRLMSSRYQLYSCPIADQLYCPIYFPPQEFYRPIADLDVDRSGQADSDEFVRAMSNFQKYSDLKTVCVTSMSFYFAIIFIIAGSLMVVNEVLLGEQVLDEFDLSSRLLEVLIWGGFTIGLIGYLRTYLVSIDRECNDNRDQILAFRRSILAEKLDIVVEEANEPYDYDEKDVLLAGLNPYVLTKDLFYGLKNFSTSLLQLCGVKYASKFVSSTGARKKTSGSKDSPWSKDSSSSKDDVYPWETSGTTVRTARMMSGSKESTGSTSSSNRAWMRPWRDLPARHRGGTMLVTSTAPLKDSGGTREESRGKMAQVRINRIFRRAFAPVKRPILLFVLRLRAATRQQCQTRLASVCVVHNMMSHHVSSCCVLHKQTHKAGRGSSEPSRSGGAVPKPYTTLVATTAGGCPVRVRQGVFVLVFTCRCIFLNPTVCW